jgi:hypothetical protein
MASPGAMPAHALRRRLCVRRAETHHVDTPVRLVHDHAAISGMNIA